MESRIDNQYSYIRTLIFKEKHSCLNGEILKTVYQYKMKFINN